MELQSVDFDSWFYSIDHYKPLSIQRIESKPFWYLAVYSLQVKDLDRWCTLQLFVRNEKLTSIVWAPMWLSALEISEAQLRSVADWFCRHNYFCVWTEALIGMIFVAGQKLSAPAPVYCPSPLPSDARTYIAGNSTLGRGFKTPLISVSSFVPSSGSTIHFRFICWSQLDSFCRRILVYIFCLTSIGLSLCDEAYKMKFLNIEREWQFQLSLKIWAR